MISLLVAFVIVQAALFQVYYGIVKVLQERGLSFWDIMRYQQLTIIPGAALLLASYRPAQAIYFATHPLGILAIAFSSTVWIVHTYFRLCVMNEVNSLAFFGALSALISLPLLLGAGILINHDLPSMEILLALAVLAMGILVGPATHAENKQKRSLAMSVPVAIILVAVGQSIDAVNAASFRYFIAGFPGTIFGTALFIVLSALTISAAVSVRRLHERGEVVRRDVRAYWLPVLFVVASIFESYGMTRIPIYTFVAIGSFTFFLSVAVDLFARRITFSYRTAFFVVSVAAGTALAALSVT